MLCDRSKLVKGLAALHFLRDPDGHSDQLELRAVAADGAALRASEVRGASPAGRLGGRPGQEALSRR